MRTLNKNKISIWISKPNGRTEAVDSNGNLTGEYITTYDVPTQIRISMYPASGELAKRVFGDVENLRFICTWTGEPLSNETLFYKSEPIDKFEEYDFYIKEVKESLNSITYGLKSRLS